MLWLRAAPEDKHWYCLRVLRFLIALKTRGRRPSIKLMLVRFIWFLFWFISENWPKGWREKEKILDLEEREL